MLNSVYRRNVPLKDFRAMVDGELMPEILRAETLHYAQIQALNKYGNTPNVIAMTQKYATTNYEQ